MRKTMAQLAYQVRSVKNGMAKSNASKLNIIAGTQTQWISLLVAFIWLSPYLRRSVSICFIFNEFSIWKIPKFRHNDLIIYNEISTVSGNLSVWESERVRERESERAREWEVVCFDHLFSSLGYSSATEKWEKWKKWEEWETSMPHRGNRSVTNETRKSLLAL